jgi:SprT protein
VPEVKTSEKAVKPAAYQDDKTFASSSATEAAIDPLIKPLSDEQQQLVIAHTHHYIEQASRLFDIKRKAVEINFNLKGRSAGMYRTRGRFGKVKREIRYNTFIFSKYFDDNLKTTVPHEVAHYVSDIAYGLKNIKPHGVEWKNIMAAFDADASVTADYDLSGIPLRRKRTYTYACQCREHELGPVRHKRISSRRNQYYCSYCNQVLVINDS